MSYFYKFKITTKQGGFTLTELLVVIAISTMMMATFVVQQNKWNDNLSVRTQSYELVLMIRQAQIYSLGVREDIGGAGDKFNVGYGIHADVTNGANKIKYTFFADRSGEGKYNEGEEVETKIFTRGVKLNKICHENTAGPNCNDVKKVDISFLRPSPNAKILFFNGAGTEIFFPSPTFLKIESDDGSEIIFVKIESNGQISIE